MPLWQSILAALLMALVSLAGVGLTLATLPGVWLILAVAAVSQFVFREPPFSWYTLAACTAAALLGELYELLASAAGARRAGGTRPGALGSIAGALIGALAGSLIFPIIGTIIGAVAGAGLGAIALERGISRRTWRDAARVGQGAASARFLAILVKAALAGAIGIVLTAAAAVL